MVQDIITSHSAIVISVLVGITVLNLILILILLFSGANLRRKLKRWKSIHETADLEVIYRKTLAEVESVKAELNKARAEVDSLQEVTQRKITTAKIMRYNAFSNTGSDLSFSIALLDDHRDGLVISSIYGREESRTYAKPVVKGVSEYPLTEEETAVLNEATGSHVIRPKMYV